MTEKDLEEKIDKLAGAVSRHNKVLRALKRKVDRMEIEEYEEANLPPSNFQTAEEVQ